MEGLVMSASITLAGLFLLGAVEGSKYVSKSKAWICRTLLANSQYLVFLVFVMMSGHLFTFINEMYQLKSPYNPTFLPPQHFVRGPLINDQGNSF